MANKSNTRTQSFGDMPSIPKKDDEISNRSREAQNTGKAGNDNKDVERERERDSRSRSSRSRSSRSRRRSRSPIQGNPRGDAAVCRDFMRGDCSRGAECRYFHPQDRADRKERSDRGDRGNRDPLSKKSWFTVCLDFQNEKCSRDDCRYFHVSDDDEDLFRETGEVSTHILNQAVCNSQLEIPSDRMRPSCKDYLKGSCVLKNCRFRHVSREEYEDEIYKSLQEALCDILGPPTGSLGRNALPQHKMAPKPGLLGPGPFPSHDREEERNFGNRQEERNFGNREQERNFGNRQEERNFGRPGSLLDDFRPEIFDRRDDDPRPLMDMRGDDNYPMRRSPGMRRTRDIDLNDFDSVRGECIRLQEELYDINREKNIIINDLELKLDDFKRSGMGPDRYEEETMLAKLNRELQLDIECLRQDNDELRAGRGRGNSYNDSRAEVRIMELEEDKQMLIEKTEKLDTQISFFKTEIQTWKNYELFVKDQISSLQSQFFIAERELSHSWGGGPPPLASQREAWSHVKSIVTLIANAVPQNLPPTKGKLDLDVEDKASPPVGVPSPSHKMGSSPVPMNISQNNMRPSAPGIRPNGPNNVRPNAPMNIRPGAPNLMRPNAPLIRPGNQIRPGAPGSIRAMGPRPGIMRPLAPGGVRPLGPGTMRPLAPGSIRPAGPGSLRPTAPGSLRPTAPGILRPNAPNIRPNTSNGSTTNAPNSVMPNSQNSENTMRPTAPGTVRPTQPGSWRAGSSNNFRPNQPSNIKPNPLLTNRPNNPSTATTTTPTTDDETPTYSNAEGYNTGGYYTSANSNYQPEGSGNYSNYATSTFANYSGNASGAYNSESGNYSANTSGGNYPTETPGSYTADASSFSSTTPVTYPASATGTYPAGSSTQYPTPAGSSTQYPTSAGSSTQYPTPAGSSTQYPTPAGSSTQYPTPAGSSTQYPTPAAAANYSADASASYAAAAGESTAYPTGATGAYSADGSAYPVANASGTYSADSSYPTDSSGNYMATGNYPTNYPSGSYPPADMYANYDNYPADPKKNADFISQVYNQPPPPPPSQNSPTTKSDNSTSNTYWRSGF